VTLAHLEWKTGNFLPKLSCNTNDYMTWIWNFRHDLRLRTYLDKINYKLSNSLLWIDYYLKRRVYVFPFHKTPRPDSRRPPTFNNVGLVPRDFSYTNVRLYKIVKSSSVWIWNYCSHSVVGKWHHGRTCMEPGGGLEMIQAFSTAPAQTFLINYLKKITLCKSRVYKSNKSGKRSNRKVQTKFN